MPDICGTDAAYFQAKQHQPHDDAIPPVLAAGDLQAPQPAQLLRQQNHN
ncbi:hypothetical protein [Shewanella sp. YIC-542]